MATPHHLHVKKYPNRRFYDATRSRHVTLSELHELVCAGHELTITDKSDGRDITNVILTQILIERDADKLAMLPSQVLHQVIRTQAQMLGTVFEGFFRQIISTQRASQEQWSQFIRNTLGMPLSPTNPFDWPRAMVQALNPGPSGPAPEHEAGPEAEPPGDDERELQELRHKLAELSRRVDELSGGE